MSRKDLTKFVRICQTAAQCFTDERNPGQLSDIIATKTCYTLILTTKAPKLVKAPQMRPQGKCRYCPAAFEARPALSATGDSCWDPARGCAYIDTQVSHL